MIDPISITLAAWMATCALTNVPEKEDLRPSTELKQKSDELFSVLEEKAPIVAVAVKEARKQPVGKAQAYVAVPVQIAALEHSVIDELVEAVAKRVKSHEEIYNNSAKLADKIGILTQGGQPIIKVQNLVIHAESENPKKKEDTSLENLDNLPSQSLFNLPVEGLEFDDSHTNLFQLEGMVEFVEELERKEQSQKQQLYCVMNEAQLLQELLDEEQRKSF